MLLDTKKIVTEAPYLTAKELDIPQKWYDALLWVRDALATRKIPRQFFEMKVWGYYDDLKPMADEIKDGERVVVHATPHDQCRTAGCIGGWMSAYLGEQLKNHMFGNGHYRRGADRIWGLFYPNISSGYYATRPKAVRAIDNYLRGADDPWVGV